MITPPVKSPATDASFYFTRPWVQFFDALATAPAYQLPVASSSTLGGVKAGEGVSIDADGVLTVTQTEGASKAWVAANYVTFPGLGETSSTAYRGDRGKTAYDHSQITTGNPHGTTKTDVGLGNVENTALSTWAGSTNITTLGTVTTGSAPASDVYAWAKAATKPSYTASEVGAPSGSGTCSGTNTGDQTLAGLGGLATVSTGPGMTGSGTSASPLKINYLAVVTEHGVVGDGVTDDTIALNAALTTYPHVIIPPDLVIYHTGTIAVPTRHKLQFLGGLGSTGTSYLKKAASMTTPAVTLAHYSVMEGGSIIGVAGNAGEGIQLLGNAAKVTDVYVSGMGGVGVRVGDAGGAGTDYNSCILQNVIAVSNGSHGFYIHDGGGTLPNANLCRLDDCFAHSNSGDGFKLDNCYYPTLVGCLSESNTGWGLNITSSCRGRVLCGGDYLESNTAGAINDLGLYPNGLTSETGLQTWQAQINGAAGVVKDLQYQVAGINRMIARLDTDASYKLIPRDTGGGAIDEAMKIVNAAGGQITFNNARPFVTGPLTATSLTGPGSGVTGVYPSTIGNGSTTQFLHDGVTPISITDYQGGPTVLSTSSRTQYATITNDPTNAAWLKSHSGTGSAPTVSSLITGPSLNVDAVRVQLSQGAGTTTSDYAILQAPFSGVTVGQLAAVGIRLKSNTGSNQSVYIAVSGSPSITGRAITVTTNWEFYPYSEAGNTFGTTSGTLYIGVRGTFTAGGSSIDVLVANPQVEMGTNVCGRYIPNTTASPLSTADYTTTDGTATLYPAPAKKARVDGVVR